MYEVEAKIALSKVEYKALKKQLKTVSYYEGYNVKQDHYFGELTSDYLRTRESKKEKVITIKGQDRNGGMEINHEINIPIKKPSAIRRLLKSFGIPQLIKKKKFTYLYSKPGLSIELNQIESLGYFLEIEALSKDKKGVEKAQKRVDGFFKRLGFNTDQYIEESYPSMIVKKVGKN